MKIKIKDIIISPDFLISLFSCVIFYFLYPNLLLNSHVISLYNTGISAISIVFSIYFGGFAIVVSSTDNDFVDFLEIDSTYTYFVNIFKYALLTLFISLFYSFLMYFVSSALEYTGCKYQCKIFFIIFIFLLFYGLINALNAALDSIRFARTRLSYMQKINKIKLLSSFAKKDQNLSNSYLSKILGKPEEVIEKYDSNFSEHGFTFKKRILNDNKVWWKVCGSDELIRFESDS